MKEENDDLNKNNFAGDIESAKTRIDNLKSSKNENVIVLNTDIGKYQNNRIKLLKDELEEKNTNVLKLKKKNIYLYNENNKLLNELENNNYENLKLNNKNLKKEIHKLKTEKKQFQNIIPINVNSQSEPLSMYLKMLYFINFLILVNSLFQQFLALFLQQLNGNSIYTALVPTILGLLLTINAIIGFNLSRSIYKLQIQGFILILVLFIEFILIFFIIFHQSSLSMLAINKFKLNIQEINKFKNFTEVQLDLQSYFIIFSMFSQFIAIFIWKNEVFKAYDNLQLKNNTQRLLNSRQRNEIE